MDRRALLKGAAATAGASLAGLAFPGKALAAETYHVALCEQYINRIMVFPVNTSWTWENRVWTWTPPTATDPFNSTRDTWTNLADIKFRDTSAYGWVALVAAGYGKVGIVDMDTSAKRDAGVADLLWSARPYGNPHAVERIPNNGSIVVASSHRPEHGELLADPYNYPDWPGYLTVYAPSVPNDPSTLTRVQQIRFQGAHGLWFDGSYLWVVGEWSYAKYRVTGEKLNTRLDEVWKHTAPKPDVLNLHSLDADYSNSAYLLMTGGANVGVKRIRKSDGALISASSTNGIKSYSRVASGESFWVKSKETLLNPDSNRNWVSDVVDFQPVDGRSHFTKGLVGFNFTAEFYKARVSSANFS